VNAWVNDEKMDAIDWMDVSINEGMKKIRENWVSDCSDILHIHNMS